MNQRGGEARPVPGNERRLGAAHGVELKKCVALQPYSGARPRD